MTAATNVRREIGLTVRVMTVRVMTVRVMTVPASRQVRRFLTT